MATTTVTFSCGHTASRDLTALKPFARTDRVKYLRTVPCNDCDPQADNEKAKFVAGKRAGELQDARKVEAQFALDPLEGAPKLVEWATRVRATLIQAAYDELDLDDDTFAETIADPASEINSAGWWVDHRETDIQDLPHLLTAALTDDETPVAGNENPY